MTKIISLLNQKGGVGKTTLSTNIAMSLKEQDKKVLLVDSDPQGSLRDWNEANEGKLISVIGLDRETLAQDIEAVKNGYDYIIIDCAPSLGLITLNSLVAADSVIIPIQCEYFALEGLGKLLNTVKSVQKIHNKDLDIEGLLLTMFDSRLRLSNQVVDEVQKHFSTMVFDTIIRRNTRLGEAPSYGESIIAYDATSKGAVNYLNLANELLKKNQYYG